MEKLDDGLKALGDSPRFEDVTRLILEKLLLDPTEQLKALPDQDTQVVYTEVLNRLFRLSEHAADHSPDARTATKTRQEPGR